MQILAIPEVVQILPFPEVVHAIFMILLLPNDEFELGSFGNLPYVVNGPPGPYLTQKDLHLIMHTFFKRVYKKTLITNN